MVTDRYLSVHHHAGVAEFGAWLAERGITPVGVDNLPGSVPLERVSLPGAPRRPALRQIAHNWTPPAEIRAVMAAASSSTRSVSPPSPTAS